MVVKTITVTEDAYEALKSMKVEDESFSEVILRIKKKRPLSDFFGVLSKETGDRMEAAMKEVRKQRNAAHHTRIERIVAEFKEM